MKNQVLFVDHVLEHLRPTSPRQRFGVPRLGVLSSQNLHVLASPNPAIPESLRPLVPISLLVTARHGTIRCQPSSKSNWTRRHYLLNPGETLEFLLNWASRLPWGIHRGRNWIRAHASDSNSSTWLSLIQISLAANYLSNTKYPWEGVETEQRTFFWHLSDSLVKNFFTFFIITMRDEWSKEDVRTSTVSETI